MQDFDIPLATSICELIFKGLNFDIPPYDFIVTRLIYEILFGYGLKHLFYKWIIINLNNQEIIFVSHPWTWIFQVQDEHFCFQKVIKKHKY